MRGYKVLTADRYSAIIWHGAGGRHYPVGETIAPAPKHGPLCVFRHKKQAEAFARSVVGMPIIIVVKCRYEPSTEVAVWYPSHAIKQLEPLHNLPFSTALATTVTCLE